MNENDFLKNYLWPSDSRLDRNFTHPLPSIDGLKNHGGFIVQSEQEETFSTNIITKYESNTLGIRFVEVYKNSQNKVTGMFVRLVGTTSILKRGYPLVLLDASVSNANLSTGQMKDVSTTLVIHLPQSDLEQREIFFNHLNEQTDGAGIICREVDHGDRVPDFWGPVFLGESKGVDLDMIRQLRHFTWNSYKLLFEQTKTRTPFDYKPIQEQMIFNFSMREHCIFERMGLKVPIEAQAAFFSVWACSV